MASSTERITVKLPDGFDPSRHSKALEKKIADKHGGGFEIDSISEGVAVATRQVTITEVSTNTTSRTKDVRLPRTVKPSDGEKTRMSRPANSTPCLSNSTMWWPRVTGP